MKVLSVLALFVAVAAAQSSDSDEGWDEIEIPDDWPGSAQPSVLPSGQPSGTGDGGAGPAQKPPMSPRRRPGNGKKKFECDSIFKINDVTFANTTAVPLKEGESHFIQIKLRGRRPFCKQSLNLNYSSETKQVSVELNQLIPFSQVFKTAGLPIESATNVQLTEGDNYFVRVKGRRPGSAHPFKSSPKRRPSPVGRQCVTLNYDSSKPNQVSLKYGVIKLAGQ